jgi:hypothetical protein
MATQILMPNPMVKSTTAASKNPVGQHPLCSTSHLNFFQVERKNVMRLAIFSFKAGLASSVNGQ